MRDLKKKNFGPSKNFRVAMLPCYTECAALCPTCRAPAGNAGAECIPLLLRRVRMKQPPAASCRRSCSGQVKSEVEPQHLFIEDTFQQFISPNAVQH